MVQTTLPILEQSYNFNLDLYRLVNNFPKAHKMVLGNKILNLGNETLEHLTEASYMRGEAKSITLDKADVNLKKILLFIRFSKDLSFTSFKQYESIAKTLIEIGKQIGGWKKWQEQENQSAVDSMQNAATGAQQTVFQEPVTQLAIPNVTDKKNNYGVTFNLESPVIKRYMDAKINNPQKVVAIKCGTFYKVFFNDAHYFQKTFNFKLRNLASKNCSQKIESCGFPVSSADKYKSKIENLVFINE